MKGGLPKTEATVAIRMVGLTLIFDDEQRDLGSQPMKDVETFEKLKQFILKTQFSDQDLSNYEIIIQYMDNGLPSTDEQRYLNLIATSNASSKLAVKMKVKDKTVS